MQRSLVVVATLAAAHASPRCPTSVLDGPLQPSSPLTKCYGSFSTACCTYEEYQTMQSQISKLSFLFGILSTSCCTASFNYLFCQQTCGTTSNEFIDISPNLITSAPTTSYGYDGPALNLTVWLCDDFCSSLYDACRNRQISGGQTVQQRYPLKEDFCAFVNTDNAAAQIGYVLGPIGCPAQGLRACGPYVQVRVRPANSSLPCIGSAIPDTSVLPQCAASTGGNPVEDDSFVDDDDDASGSGGGGGSNDDGGAGAPEAGETAALSALVGLGAIAAAAVTAA